MTVAVFRFFGLSMLLTVVGALQLGAHHRQFSDTERWDPQYQLLKKHHPQGIGKSFMGREISGVMGFAGVKWLERPARPREEGLAALIQALDVSKGDHIADIGAGSGVLTLPLAQRVGPSGRVYAVEIQQEMLTRLEKRAKKKKLQNIVGVLGTTKSPQLKPRTIDLAFLVDVYHELEYPLEMMQEIYKALKPGGRLALVEYRAEDPKVPIKKLHKMSLKQIRKELAHPRLKFKYGRVFKGLPRQHVVFFRKSRKP